MQDIVVSRTWRDHVEELFVRLRETRLLTAIGAVAVVSFLVIWSRTPAPRVAPPARGSTVVAQPLASPSGVVVHVAGAVHRPGLYAFPAGARIADAIATAGGALPRARLDALNLAEVLVDGAQIVVPRRGDTNPLAAPTSAADPTAPIHLNSADAVALETVPGIGPVTAAAIVAYRDEHGGFASIDELIDVDGIGPATLEALRPYLAL